MYAGKTDTQTILRLVNGGAMTRQRLEPVVEARAVRHGPAVMRALDWLALVAMGIAGAAAGIVSIANALPR